MVKQAIVMFNRSKLTTKSQDICAYKIISYFLFRTNLSSLNIKMYIKLIFGDEINVKKCLGYF